MPDGPQAASVVSKETGLDAARRRSSRTRMRIRLLLAAVFTAISAPHATLVAADNPLRGAVAANVEKEFPSLLALYTDLHRNPELSDRKSVG